MGSAEQIERLCSILTKSLPAQLTWLGIIVQVAGNSKTRTTRKEDTVGL